MFYFLLLFFFFWGGELGGRVGAYIIRRRERIYCLLFDFIICCTLLQYVARMPFRSFAVISSFCGIKLSWCIILPFSEVWWEISILFQTQKLQLCVQTMFCIWYAVCCS